MRHQIAAWSVETVPVALSDTGALLVGPAVSGPAGLGAVALETGTLWVDPAQPHLPPRLVLADPGAVAHVVRPLYGDEVAEVARRVVDEGAPAVGEVPVASSDVLRDLQRLGLLDWVERTEVWPVDRGLVALERAVHRLRHGELLDEDVDPSTEVDVLRRGILAGPSLLDAAVRDDALEELLGEVADLGVLLLPEPAAARALAVALGTPGARPDRRASGRPGGPARLLSELVPEPAVHAGSDRLAVGSSAPDWSRVDARTVSRSETAVTWVVSGDAPVSVSVSALRPPPTSSVLDLPMSGGSPGPPLVGVFGQDWPMPLVQGVLTADVEGSWRTTLTIPPGARAVLDRALETGTLVVDVHDPGRARTPARGVAADAASARRWAGRAVWALRAGPARRGDTEDVRAATVAALTRARNLWTVVAEAPGADPGSMSCAAVCEALLDGLGAGRRALGRGWVPTGSLPDVAPPAADLADAGWLPTAAEVFGGLGG